MKFLLLFIGLACCIAGLFLRKDAERKIKSNILLALGALFIIAGFSYLRIGHVGAILAIVFVLNAVNVMRGWLGSIICLALIPFLFFTALYFPSVALDNDIIKMDGKFGATFKVSEIQSVDTVNVIPRVGRRRSGVSSPANLIGNFEMKDERKTVKLRLLPYKPPYIKIRMNDNSLFILNFKEPDKTVEFYEQLKNVINSN